MKVEIFNNATRVIYKISGTLKDVEDEIDIIFEDYPHEEYGTWIKRKEVKNVLNCTAVVIRQRD